VTVVTECRYTVAGNKVRWRFSLARSDKIVVTKIVELTLAGGSQLGGTGAPVHWGVVDTDAI
jgi:hypothetical protein